MTSKLQGGEMRLLELRLKNWKQFKDYAFTPDGNDAAIYAQNGVGKTVGHYDAFLWLLLGIDSQNRSDYKIKTEDENGKAIHFLDHSVEATFLVDGRKLTLKKVYKEKWTKPRGKAEQEFDGHETLHYVDEVPLSKGEYDKVIAGIADRETFKLLTNPHHFLTELKTDARRKMLFDTFGDMTDAEIIASTAKLSRLPAVLDGKTIDERKSVIKETRTRINKRLIEIPAEITGAESVLADVSGLKVDVLTGQKIALEGKRSNKEKELARMEAGGAVAEKRKALVQVETQMIEIENQHRAGANEAAAGKSEELRVAQGMLSDLSAKKDSLARQLDANKGEITRIEARAATLRETWQTENDKELTFEQPEQSTTCPTCGQAIPKAKFMETFKAARERAEAAFNKGKSEKLEQITADGKALAEQIKGIEDNCTSLAKEVTSLEAEMLKAKTLVDGLGDDVATQAAPALSENPEYQAAQATKAEIETAILTLEQEGRGAIAVVEQEIESINAGIQAVQNDLAKFDQRKDGAAHIEDLKVEEKDLAGQFEALEADLFLIEQFLKTKVELLTDKINSAFELARFKLFEEQVNGALNPICEATYLWNPPSVGQTVQIGMDIIRAFSEKRGIIPPVFVDNAESVTRIIDMPGQVIRLIHSPDDTALRVEVSEAEKVKEAV